MPQIHCHRENLQDCTLFHFAGSHNGNGLRDIGLFVCKSRLSLRKDKNLLFLTIIWTSWSRRFIRAKVLWTGETLSDANAFVRRAWRQPSTNFLVSQKLGYSVCALWTHTCLILLLVRSDYPARKTVLPTTKLKGALQKGKELKLKKMIMRVRKMTIEQGRRAELNRFPNFHKTGSVRGMKRLYYGNKCLLVRCGDYIYNRVYVN